MVRKPYSVFVGIRCVYHMLTVLGGVFLPVEGPVWGIVRSAKEQKRFTRKKSETSATICELAQGGRLPRNGEYLLTGSAAPTNGLTARTYRQKKEACREH